MHTAMVGVSAVATLLIADAAGTWLSGAPNTAGVLGTATGTLVLSRLMARRGRRGGLMFGYAAATLGALVGFISVFSGVLLLIIPAMILLGTGNGAAQLSRYAAADLYPPARRGFAVGAVVWAGTIGAVVGPALISPAAEAGPALGIPTFGGVFLVALVMTAGALLVLGAGPRTESRDPTDRSEPRAASTRFPLNTHPRTEVALASMITGQITMVAIMTITPLHIHEHGRGLGAVGIVLSAHALGMFALSPATGWLTDRLGSPTTILMGLGTLVAAASIAVAGPGVEGPTLPVSMFLLGYGWNLTHVGGSALLTHGLPISNQIGVQGAVDTAVWTFSAVAALGSGLIFALGGYSVLAIVGGGLVMYPAAVFVRRRNVLRGLGRAPARPGGDALSG